MGCSLSLSLHHYQPERPGPHRRHRGLRIVNQPAGGGLLDTLKLTPVDTYWARERERKSPTEEKGKNKKKKQINYPVPSPSIKQSNTLQKNQTFGLLLLCPIFKLKSHHCYVTQATELVVVLSTGWLSRLNRCLFVLFYSVGHLWSVEVVNISEPNYCSQCYVRDLSDSVSKAEEEERQLGQGYVTACLKYT